MIKASAKEKNILQSEPTCESTWTVLLGQTQWRLQNLKVAYLNGAIYGAITGWLLSACRYLWFQKQGTTKSHVEKVINTMGHSKCLRRYIVLSPRAGFWNIKVSPSYFSMFNEGCAINPLLLHRSGKSCQSWFCLLLTLRTPFFIHAFLQFYNDTKFGL